MTDDISMRRCETCGDDLWSLENDVCGTCRLGMTLRQCHACGDDYWSDRHDKCRGCRWESYVATGGDVASEPSDG